MPFNHKWVPKPFNPKFRPGFGEAVHNEYASYCKFYPNSTKEERKAEYKRICGYLEKYYPTVQETGDLHPAFIKDKEEQNA